MKRLLAALLALALAGQANARALVVDVSPFSANTSTGRSRLSEVGLSMLNSLGGDYRVVNINDFRSGTTAAISPNLVSQQIRDGKFWPNGCGNGSAETYGLIIVMGAHVDSYRGTITTTGRETSVGGYATLHNAAGSFTYLRPGMLVTGTGITAPARVVSVDSLGGTIRVAGTVAGGANITLTWETPLRPDSLTLVGNSTNGNTYPRVPVLYIGNFMDAGNLTTTSGRCSTGVGALQTYGAQEDSTVNVYEVGNPYRSWKARPGHVVNSTRDTRGWRPIIGRVSTRQQNPGLYDGNYDFPVAPLAFSTNPDTVALWVINNRDAAGAKIGGDAAPLIFCSTTHLFGTNSTDPGLMLSAFALADSLSGGALFGSSKTIPKTLSIHIDDGWKRGDSRYNVAGAYGGIGVDDTTAFKATIDSLAALGIKFVVGVEADSLNSVLLATGVTGNGLYYDQRWWARAPLAHYTPHCHAGLSDTKVRAQNTGTIGTAGYTGKYLRPLDLWGIARARSAFGSVDSLLAYGLTDYQNDIADTAATYWLNKRAIALLDSTFGDSRVDGVVMPPADDWTNDKIKHTRYRQHGLGVDSVIAAVAMSGGNGIRVNSGINVVGSDDSLTTNNYGYYTTWRDTKIGLAAGGPGMPTWTPARVYGRPCPLVPTRGYPATASETSWSRNRTSHGGETVLMGLLIEKTATGSDAGPARGSYVLALHCGDLGSSADQGGEATRPMFYTIKYVVNQIRTANAHALKDLVRIVYPEEVRP